MIMALTGAASEVKAKAESRAVKAATDFEAVLLNTVLGAVQRSFRELPGSRPVQGAEAYDGLAMQELSSHLAQAGGIGLAGMIREGILRLASHAGGEDRAAKGY